MGDRPSGFVALQRLSRSFEQVRLGRELDDDDREQLMLTAQSAGACALPLLERRLRRGNDQESLWAFELVLVIAADDELAERAAEVLARAAGDGAANETARMMSLALMSQLEMDIEVQSDELGSVEERSVEELARHLEHQPDVARAADHLVGELDPLEILRLDESLCAREGHRAEALVDELLCRDDIGEQVRSELCRLGAPIRDRRRREPIGPRSGPVSRTWIGRKPGANTVLIAAQRIAGSRPARRRALCCALQGDLVVDGMYRDDFTPRGVEREIVRPLERDGFVFRELPLKRARALLSKSASTTHRRGVRLPRAYFLGRDILGLSDEHVTARRRQINRDHARALLARSVDLMAAEQYDAARAILERYRQSAPDDDAGAAALGSCLVQLGDLDGALVQLRRATALRPGESEHYWNLAAVSHQAGDRAGCYLAMRDYVACVPSPFEPPSHLEQAASVVASYERRARLEFPGVTATAVARAEQHAYLANRLVAGGSLGEAATELRRAVRAAADHYPSWAQLGSVHAERGESRKARRCFQRALEIRPDYAPARTALDALGPDTAARNAAARALPKRKRPAHKRRGARISPR